MRMRRTRLNKPPVEPMKQTSLQDEHMDAYICPYCCATLRSIDDNRAKYPEECRECGQKIKWSNTR